MSREEVRRQHAMETVSWSEWEKRVDGLLRTNGWEFWQDRVVGPGPLLKAGVPRAMLGKILKVVNSYGRKAGLPDRVVRKRFARPGEVPLPLAEAITGHEGPDVPYAYVGNPDVLDRDSVRQTPFVVVGFIEMKTGSGRTTEAQEAWLQAAAMCPGMFAVRARPHNYDRLADLLGGRRPL